ncbi:Peptidyl-prolyl cis-trans isomerase ppiB [Pseudomonas sp. NGC7]
MNQRAYHSRSSQAADSRARTNWRDLSRLFAAGWQNGLCAPLCRDRLILRQVITRVLRTLIP